MALRGRREPPRPPSRLFRCTDSRCAPSSANQVFSPRTGAWDNLKRDLKGVFNDSLWEHLAGTESEPFVLGDHKRIAIKAIDDRGNELLVVKDASEATPE